MTRPPRPAGPAALAASAVAFAALVAGAPLVSPSSQTFSRSRWIVEHERAGMRFSGGVLPASSSPAMEALLSLPASTSPLTSPSSPTTAPRRKPAGPRDLRVSFDILPPDAGSAAQPETEAEPTLAIDPADGRRLLGGYQEDRFDDGGARALTYALSTDGGRHWGEGLLPHLTQASGGEFQRASDPWLAFGPAHRAYFASIAFDETDARSAIALSVSADGGASWADPVLVHELTQGGLDDKDAVAVDGDPRSPFFGRVYVGWDISPSDTSQPQPQVIARSSDGGATFGPPVVIQPQGVNLGIIPVVGPGGVVTAVWLHFPGGGPAPGSIESAYSTDGGDTWSAPVEIATGVVVGVSGLRTGEGLPSAAVDPRKGTVYVVWEDQRFTPGVDQIALSVSADGRGGWSPPRRVSDGPDWAPSFSPAVAANARGAIGIAYYSLRNSARNSQVLADEYIASGDPRKKTFGRGQRLSAASWDVRFAAMTEGGFFLGDYQGLATNGTAFMPLWIATFAPSTLEAGARQPDAYVLAPAGR
ncbi:MAG TPA: sialidase family protein [Thermoanaerobaculia bacterium]